MGFKIAVDQMPITFTHMTVRDIRFFTSRTRAGSDAKTLDSDKSAPYLVLNTDHPKKPRGSWSNVHSCSRQRPLC